MAYAWKKWVNAGHTDSQGNIYITRRKPKFGQVVSEWQVAYYPSGGSMDDFTLLHSSNYDYAKKQGWKDAALEIAKNPKTGSNFGKTDLKTDEITSTGSDWGAPQLTKEMFINADGSPKDVEEIYKEINPLLPGIEGNELRQNIIDNLSRYQGPEQEELDYVQEDYEKDVYGVQKEARGFTGAMGNVYGTGMMGGMRGMKSKQEDIAESFKEAGQTRDRSIYKLEEAAGDEFETGISDWVQPGWLEDKARFGGLVTKHGMKKSKKTFLEVLSKLPDAKGS
tara:strand:+ start:4776 stop:5615 length:840 start_codon:yes stop_codon:yes gene_type:complete